MLCANIFLNFCKAPSRQIIGNKQCSERIFFDVFLANSTFLGQPCLSSFMNKSSLPSVKGTALRPPVHSEII
ncbi:hypothetical protein HOLleu_39814 [Holothuria leucospilota]|uniref:Uncharacterized protein n=1 Tax=Holothuria leucospilota TaxID=206669 RepID=A0A9Q0YCS4_HOLLE|nr:hypothetical protein HOLleu_39814 [Holothuria leucospilota]